MTKRRRTRVRPMPEPTRELTGLERQVQLANEWYMRLAKERRDAIAASADSLDISGAMLQAWKNA